jgi:Rad3-related DNA helicase
MRDSLNIKPKEAVFYRMGSVFPPASRPIYFEPVGSLSFKNREETFPKLVRKVDKICQKYPKEKGIIHTHNFQIAKLLMDRCSSKYRFLFQKNFDDKSKMLKAHADSTNTVIVAPAMHEGLDLIDDLSRFQIICKVPYPNHHANPQLKKRSDLNWDYYVWITALKMVQSYGRSIRTEKDYADTFVLDGDFKRFLQMAVDILPDWFLEPLQNI